MMEFFSFAVTYFPYVARGIAVTAELTLLSLCGSLALGLLGALAKGSGRRWLAIIATGYVEVLRGCPY
jgi:polar amino acid transport system permease protein